MWEAVRLLEANYEAIKREFSAAVELAREGRHSATGWVGSK
jgi:hypothetical protein